MGKLSYDVRNYLAQQEDLRAVLAKSATFETWVFADKPLGKIEGVGQTNGLRSAMVVIVEEGQSEIPNEHNTLRFPRLFVDVWADPTRNENGDVKMNDADNKIFAVHKIISKYLHLVDSGTNNGMPHQWGTPQQVAEGRASVINNSRRTSEISYRDVRDGNGARMGTVTYGVSVL